MTPERSHSPQATSQTQSDNQSNAVRSPLQNFRQQAETYENLLNFTILTSQLLGSESNHAEGYWIPRGLQPTRDIEVRLVKETNHLNILLRGIC